MVDKQNCKYLLALDAFEKFGPVSIKKMEQYFSDWKTAFESPINELVNAGIEFNIAKEFTNLRQNLSPDSIMQSLNRYGIKYLIQTDADYPELLKNIYDPPPVLYYRGKINKYNLPIAIVGSRVYSGYGKRVAENLTCELTRNGFTIVSGLAYGIDTIAHQTALDNSGQTIAVLGNGLDIIYPARNKQLAEQIIASGGLVLSEFPPGSAPLKHHFPRRNRIISGLSLGVLVIEASYKSGSLITVKHALDQNRDVMAVPGNIYSPNSIGPNRLIASGAKPVMEIKDILDIYNIESQGWLNRHLVPLETDEKKVFRLLNGEPISHEEIARITKQTATVVAQILSSLEAKGLARKTSSNGYCLNRKLP